MIREKDVFSKQPWAIFSYTDRGPGVVYRYVVVDGFNRWTGEPIHWELPDFNDGRYDLRGAVCIVAR